MRQIADSPISLAQGRAQAISKHVVCLPPPLALSRQHRLLFLLPSLLSLQYGRAGLRWRRFCPHQPTVAAGIKAATAASTSTAAITAVATVGVSLLLGLLLECMYNYHVHLENRGGGGWGLRRRGLGFGVWGLWFGVWGLGFGAPSEHRKS